MEKFLTEPVVIALLNEYLGLGLGLGLGACLGVYERQRKGEKESDWDCYFYLNSSMSIIFFLVHPINFTNSRHWKRQLNPVLSNPVTTLRVSVNSCWSLISIWSRFEGEEQVHLNWLKLASSRMLFGTSGTAWTVSAESAAGTIDLQRKDPVTSENSYNFPPSRQPCQEKIL